MVHLTHGPIQDILTGMFKDQEGELGKCYPPTTHLTLEHFKDLSSGFEPAKPLPVVVKELVGKRCDMHATIIIQWSRILSQDGIGAHILLEFNSNKELHKLFGYDTIDIQSDPHIFSRLIHPKDWSLLISKCVWGWINGSKSLSLVATCINKWHCEFPCLIEFRVSIVDGRVFRVYCFFIPLPTPT